MRIRPRILCIALALAIAPPTLGSGGSVQPGTASCQNGTCCPEPESTCIIGSWVRADRYALLTGGPCPTRV